MAIRDHLLPINAGNQMWQLLASNLRSGPHPYNVGGFCATLVAQWLLEIRCDAGAAPEALGRHLLQADLGKHGYSGIASSHAIYRGLPPGTAANQALFARHSGGMLERQTPITVYNAEDHWRVIRAGIYNEPIADSPRVNRARAYSGHVGLAGPNFWPLRWLAGAEWGHAIGLHSNGHRVYFFEPNYGVFIFDQTNRPAMSAFVRDLWTEYGATEGRLAEVL